MSFCVTIAHELVYPSVTVATLVYGATPLTAELPLQHER